jgi:hypothetical protein
MKKILFFIILVLSISSFSYAATLTLSTTYPSPNGSYKNVTVANSLEVGPAVSPIYGIGYTFSSTLYSEDLDGNLNVPEGTLSLGVLTWGLYGVGNGGNLLFDCQEANPTAYAIEGDVSGATGTPRLQFLTNGATGCTATGDGPVGMTESMTLTGTGHLGINNVAPGAKLSIGTDLTGTAASTTLKINAGALGGALGNTLKLASFGFTSTNATSLGLEALRTAAGADWTTTAMGLVYDVDNTSPVNNAQVWLASTGGVGIGKTNPGAKLDVLGTGTGSGLIGSAGCGGNYTALSLNGNADTTCGNFYNILSSPTDQTLYLNRPPGLAIRFRENNVDQMVIATGGNITMTSGLNVNGAVTNLNVGLNVNGAVTNLTDGLTVTNAVTNLNDGLNVSNAVTSLNDGLVVAGNVTDTGNVTVTDGGANSTVITPTEIDANGFFYSSDERLKKNIQVIDHALDKVKQINGVTFNWKKSGEKSLGVIAQNVETVLPELVKTNKNGMKAVEYGNIVGLLIEAIKEQQQEIEVLQKKVSVLEHK